VKREEVDRRVKDDQEKYSLKFSEEAKSLCQQVQLSLWISNYTFSLLCYFEHFSQVCHISFECHCSVFLFQTKL